MLSLLMMSSAMATFVEPTLAVEVTDPRSELEIAPCSGGHDSGGTAHESSESQSRRHRNQDRGSADDDESDGERQPPRRRKDSPDLTACNGKYWSIAKIAADRGSTPRTVRQWLRKHGVPTVRDGLRLWVSGEKYLAAFAALEIDPNATRRRLRRRVPMTKRGN